MRFDLNLATKTYIDTRKLNLSIALITVLLLLFTAVNVREFFTNHGEKKRLQMDMAAQQARFKTEAPDVSEKQFQALLKRINSTNDIIRKKSMSWLSLLDHIESVVPDGVSLSAIEPDPKSSNLKISGVALNFKNLRKLVEQLEDSKYFSEVFLVRQAEGVFVENRKGTIFEITCKVTF